MMKLRLLALAFPLVLSCAAAQAMTPVVQPGISFQQALDVVSKAGYKNIHKIEREHDFYEVVTFDEQGKKMRFKIDPVTGAMTPMAKGEHCKHHGKHHNKHHGKHHMKHHVKHVSEAKIEN